MEREARDTIKSKVRAFLLRDYVHDANRLNQLLSKNTAAGAGFVIDMPPIPYTGDPFRLKNHGKLHRADSGSILGG